MYMYMYVYRPKVMYEISFVFFLNRIFKLEPSGDGKGHTLKELINIKIGDGSEMSTVSSLFLSMP